MIFPFGVNDFIIWLPPGGSCRKLRLREKATEQASATSVFFAGSFRLCFQQIHLPLGGRHIKEFHAYMRKCRKFLRHLWNNQIKLLAFLVFALLVCDTAACLTSGLARCLAFAAAAVLYACSKVSCVECLNSLHYSISFV